MGVSSFRVCHLIVAQHSVHKSSFFRCCENVLRQASLPIILTIGIHLVFPGYASHLSRKMPQQNNGIHLLSLRLKSAVWADGQMGTLSPCCHSNTLTCVVQHQNRLTQKTFVKTSEDFKRKIAVWILLKFSIQTKIKSQFNAKRIICFITSLPVQKSAKSKWFRLDETFALPAPQRCHPLLAINQVRTKVNPPMKCATPMKCTTLYEMCCSSHEMCHSLCRSASPWPLRPNLWFLSWNRCLQISYTLIQISAHCLT